MMIGASAVIFLSLSTVTNAILQGLNRMNVPVRNALISLPPIWSRYAVMRSASTAPMWGSCSNSAAEAAFSSSGKVVSQGFGYKLGIDLPGERRGMIPNAQFYDNAFGRWNPLSVISISIGQGEVNATPLQIANLGSRMYLPFRRMANTLI